MIRHLAFRRSHWFLLSLLFLLTWALVPRIEGEQPDAKVQDEISLPVEWVNTLKWRNIGPANMSGRITAISVFEADPTTYWVATASGGLLKTTNNGVTFTHQFDKEATVSIGDVCVAPSNRDIVWVGTGEGNPRNSVSYGDGVYKSMDGGKTWKKMGLDKTFQIGRIAIHPRNPSIVYVGALGRLYGSNPERGLYKTTDGGKTWEKIFYLDDRTGVIDIAMHPNDPDTLLVAMWERQRHGFDSFIGPDSTERLDPYDPNIRFGESAGIYKTTDGGKNFKKMTTGLPTCKLGRIGLDYYRKDPNVVFAVVDSEKIGLGTAPAKKIAQGNAEVGFKGEDADPGVRVTSTEIDGPADKAGLRVDDIIVAFDKKEIKNNADFQEQLRGHNAGDKVLLKVKRNKKDMNIEVLLGQRPGTEKQPPPAKKGRPHQAHLSGQRENIQDQQGPDGFQYGGIYRSSDGGETWTRVNSLNPRPMYFSVVRVDPQDENHIYVLGISQHRSIDGGKTFKADAGKGVHADCHALWINPRDSRHMLIGGDGGVYVSYDRATNWDHFNHLSLGQFYHVTVCNKRPYWVYGGLQDNGSWGGPSIGLKGNTGPINEDWKNVGGGDGFVCRVDPFDPDLIYVESQNGVMSRRHLKTGETAAIRPKGTVKHRFNWNTPFILSQHNPRIFYCAGEVVFRSLDRGNDLKIISPEITVTKNGSGTALAESPLNPDVLWAGTDDGGLWVTRNGGVDWTEVGAALLASQKVERLDKLLNDKQTKAGPLMLKRCWVATIEASRKVEGRAYVCFDAHRSNDDRPHVFVTEDFGKTWRNITSNLPGFGSTRCLREDVDNPDLLYCGTEFGVFVSLNRGTTWQRINNNLPTVAVHEIAIHPTVGEIVAATHGRSLWILDVSALRQMKAEVFKAKAHLFKPNTAVRWQTDRPHGGTNRRFAGENPPAGAQIYYSLAEPADKVVFKILDVEGKTLSQWTSSAKAGFHRTTWDMTRPAPAAKGADKGKAGQPGRRFAGAGEFRVVMNVDGQELFTTVRVEADPNLPPERRATEEELPENGNMN